MGLTAGEDDTVQGWVEGEAKGGRVGGSGGWVGRFGGRGKKSAMWGCVPRAHAWCIARGSLVGGYIVLERGGSVR